MKSKTVRDNIERGAELALERKRKEDNEYKRTHRLSGKPDWELGKATVDACNSIEELKAYAFENFDQENDRRSGIHSMKLNPWEYALIKWAMAEGGFRSTRELLLQAALNTTGYRDEQARRMGVK
ncbi:hypothetical protein JCM19241_26 [Vibrio ishigakensis]|uniref:Uncharacterized protein n=1 Tax=Vibrio ishigakensis TaxID=1481914 RepID=A0A0B8QNX5_9VIBR|nr:hypothetical protein JCM19241_26 [Vibrio ishigakensis]